MKLCEFCSIKSGGTPARSKKEYWENGNIPWVKISDFTGKYLSSTEEYITAKGLECSSAKVFSRGTLLYTIFATLGEVCILNIDATTNQAIAGIVIENNAVEKEYLYYFLTSLKEKINRIGRGVAQNNINISILRNIEVPILERSKQKNIADILNHIDSLISKRRQQLASLDLLVKARFVEMFGTYQANEKSWITGTIRDVVSEVRYGSSRPAVDGGDYPYLRMNNITYDGELDLSDTKRIDIPDNELEKCTVRRGDVLFNRTNSKELVGKTCVYNRDEMMVLAGFVIRVRVNDKVLPEFLSAFLNTDFSKHMLLGMCKTAIGQANINAQEMQNIGLYIPPIDLQRQFVDVKMQIDKAKLAVQKEPAGAGNVKESVAAAVFWVREPGSVGAGAINTCNYSFCDIQYIMKGIITMEIKFYEDQNGNVPVREFLDSLDIKMRLKMLRSIQALQDMGISLRMPLSEALNDGIFELRAKVGTDISRVMYFFVVGNQAVLTHGFVKKTQKTPPREIERAKKLRDDYVKRFVH